MNIQKSYEALYDLSKLTEAEQNILEAFSVFPYILLVVDVCNQWLLSDAGVGEDSDILKGLYRKGWLQFDTEQESYAMHPVFAQFIYEKCKPSKEKHHGLIKACQRNLEIPESGSAIECQKYIPFAESIVEKVDMEKDIEYVSFISSIAYLLYYIAEYKKAEELYEKELRIRERVLGEGHSDTATSYGYLAGVYEKQGEYDKAKELFEKSLTIYEKNSKENILYIAATYNNIALVYRQQGKDNEAKDLFEKSLAIHEKELGEKSHSILENYCNLSLVYLDLGNLDKITQILPKVIIIWQAYIEIWVYMKVL